MAAPRACGETRSWLHVAACMCCPEDSLGPNSGLLSCLRIGFAPPSPPFILIKAKERICAPTQLFHYILRLRCFQRVQLREIRCGGELKRKPLWLLCALKSISLYFSGALKCFSSEMVCVFFSHLLVHWCCLGGLFCVPSQKNALVLEFKSSMDMI